MCQRGRWPQGGWIVKSHIGWGGEYRPRYLPLSTRFKAVRGEDSPKRTISRARRWDVTDGIRARLWSVCQRGRWAPRGVDCKVPHRLGRRTKGAIYRPGYLPLSTRFKAVRGEDSPKRTISRARRWDVTTTRNGLKQGNKKLQVHHLHPI